MMVKICINCNKEYTNESSYCTVCGNELENKDIKSFYKLSEHNEKNNSLTQINNNTRDKGLFYKECSLTVNKTIMEYLNKYTEYKENVIYNSNNQLKTKTDFYIYETHILFDNQYFTQKIFYDMLNNIVINDNLNFVLNTSIELILNSNNIIYLNTKLSEEDAKYIENTITQRISCPPEIGQNKLLKVYNTTIIERLETIYKLDNLTSLKQDISILDKAIFEEKGVLLIYDDHLKLENQIFIQEFPYNMIKSMKENDNAYIFLFNNDEEIKILFDKENSLDKETKDIIKSKIENPPHLNHFNTPSIQPTSLNYNNPQNQFNHQYIPPLNQKSKAIGLILNMLLVGLGYAYVGKWGEGIVLLVCYIILWILGLTTLIFGIGFIFILIAILLWIASLFSTNSMIDNYNKGRRY